jgi:hypothetical protein
MPVVRTHRPAAALRSVDGGLYRSRARTDIAVRLAQKAEGGFLEA